MVYITYLAMPKEETLQITRYLHRQQTPKAFAQGPLAIPPLAAHSDSVKHVPLSPVFPWQPPLPNWTTVNSGRTAMLCQAMLKASGVLIAQRDSLE